MRNRIRLCTILVALCLTCVVYPAHAHPGALDEDGGHYNHSTGEYHYHHGYPAHSHDDGCPYAYRDRTGQNSGISSSGNSSHTRSDSGARSSSSIVKAAAGVTLVSFVAIAAGGCFVLMLVVHHLQAQSKKKNKQEHEEHVRQQVRMLYATHDLRTLSGMPERYYVDGNNTPRERDVCGDYVYGESLDVYLTANSYVYHRKGCIYGRYAILRNALSDARIYLIRERRPCSKCRPEPLPDDKWFVEYMKHIKECEKYGIAPKREPEGFHEPRS